MGPVPLTVDRDVWWISFRRLSIPPLKPPSAGPLDAIIKFPGWRSEAEHFIRGIDLRYIGWKHREQSSIHRQLG